APAAALRHLAAGTRRRGRPDPADPGGDERPAAGRGRPGEPAAERGADPAAPAAGGPALEDGVSMPCWGRRAGPAGGPATPGRPRAPEAVRAAAGLRSGEKVLAAAQDDPTRGWVLATQCRLLQVSDPEGPAGARVELDRPWLEVDTGAWD